MARFFLQRLLYAIMSLLVLSITIFLLIRVSGDPAVLLASPTATVAELEAIRINFGLDQALHQQFLRFMADVLRGDLGMSFYYGMPVLDLFLDRLPHSIVLAVVALIFSLLIGVPIGIMSALRQGGYWDRIGKFVALVGMSFPQFWIGLVLILIFSVQLRWLPSSGSGTVWHLIMPSVALGWYFAAAHMRITRSSMLDVLGSEYIKLARLKGVPEFHVVVRHAFRNALIPLITLAGINVVQMITASVIVETVFAWPGIGRLLYEGISSRDFPIVQGVVLLGGVMIIIMNLIVDILYAAIDPRIRVAN